MPEYKAQYLVPIVVTFHADNDGDAIQEAENIGLREIIKHGDASYPDIGYHALITGDRTVDET